MRPPPRSRRLHRRSSPRRDRTDHPRQLPPRRQTVHADGAHHADQRAQHHHRRRRRSRPIHPRHRHHLTPPNEPAKSRQTKVKVTADAIMQRLSAVGLRSGDVCLAVSESGSNALTIAAAREAKVAGASVIGLTAFARTALAELADVALIAGATYRWDLDRVGGNIVQTVLLSSLHSAVIGRVQKAPKVSDRYIETVAQLTIEEPGEPPAP
ncbi:SIS domain-containing protein [Gordonia sp. AC31]|nr:SIS domain-containing protein [Gordonia sp. AC31]